MLTRGGGLPDEAVAACKPEFARRLRVQIKGDPRFLCDLAELRVPFLLVPAYVSTRQHTSAYVGDLTEVRAVLASVFALLYH